MLASELLTEWNDTLLKLEGEVMAIQRTKTALEGLAIVMGGDTGHVSGSTDKVERNMVHLLEQLDDVEQRLDNLEACRAECFKMIDRLPARYGAVLSLRYLAGLTQAQAAEKMGCSLRNARYLETAALAAMDDLLGG